MFRSLCVLDIILSKFYNQTDTEPFYTVQPTHVIIESIIRIPKWMRTFEACYFA